MSWFTEVSIPIRFDLNFYRLRDVRVVVVSIPIRFDLNETI